MLDNGPGFSDLMTQRAGMSVPYKPIDPSGNRCALRMTLEVLTSACLLEMDRISLQHRCMFWANTDIWLPSLSAGAIDRGSSALMELMR